MSWRGGDGACGEDGMPRVIVVTKGERVEKRPHSIAPFGPVCHSKNHPNRCSGSCTISPDTTARLCRGRAHGGKARGPAPSEGRCGRAAAPPPWGRRNKTEVSFLYNGQKQNNPEKENLRVAIIPHSSLPRPAYHLRDANSDRDNL